MEGTRKINVLEGRHTGVREGNMEPKKGVCQKETPPKSVVVGVHVRQKGGWKTYIFFKRPKSFHSLWEQGQS